MHNFSNIINYKSKNFNGLFLLINTEVIKIHSYLLNWSKVFYANIQRIGCPGIGII